jgi:asparagine synthase (glutamine-hydrolysing)
MSCDNKEEYIMCGISGIYALGTTRNYLNDINLMNSMVAHRGPDNTGSWNNDFAYLGHTRLAIIDIDKKSNQPFKLNERYSIVFNGEIYNYLEIKQELESSGCVFSTTSDTEVLLCAYQTWREKVLCKLNGIFAFCIVDNLERTFFIARDRLGVKPLYYCLNKDGLYIFSEPKQVIYPDIIKAEPNNDAIYEYLAFQFPMKNKTFFKDIYILEPGFYGYYSDQNGLQLHSYWECGEFSATPDLTNHEYVDTIKNLFHDSVRLQLRSDVEIGCYLSGGIDSTIVSSLATTQKKHIKTFTFASCGKYDESISAQKTATKIGSTHVQESLDNSWDFWNLWCYATYYMDEPRVGFSLIPQILISNKVREHIKVVLGGQGGDELFWGYGWNTILALSPFSNIAGLNAKQGVLFKYLKSKNLKQFLKKIYVLLRHKSYSDLWFTMGCFKLLNSTMRDKMKRLFPKISTASDVQDFEIKNWLHALLHVEDRASMSMSVESRVPILDHRIVELAYNIPPPRSINGFTNKQILLDAFADYFDSVNEKSGYAVPLNDWIKQEETSLNIENIINDKDSFIYTFIAYPIKIKLNLKQIWMLVSLEIWYKIFITKEITPKIKLNECHV